MVQCTLAPDGYGQESLATHAIYFDNLSLGIPMVCNKLTDLCFLLWQFNDMINVPFTSKPFVAGLVAYILDNTLQIKESAVRKDRGNHWWEKFRSFKKDARSQEFYSLPFNLNKFFPSVWSERRCKMNSGTRPLFIWAMGNIILLVWPVEAYASPMLLNFVCFWTRWSNWTVETIRIEVYHVLFSDLHGSASDNLVVVSSVKLAMYSSTTIYSM